ncbi:MAG: GNAT family N-acetyltransferase [Alphaproteobacteria bacterium]
MTSNYKPSLISADINDYPIIQNMARFYVYDMSRYCGNIEGWECPDDGLYECFDLKIYFGTPGRYAFLVKIDNELAGFVLINKIGSNAEVDWNIGEFFILAKFQDKGVAKQIAFQIFDKFRGIWETSAMPDNIKAINFWRKTVAEYTKDNFIEGQKTIGPTKFHPEAYSMIVFRFEN